MGGSYERTNAHEPTLAVCRHVTRPEPPTGGKLNKKPALVAGAIVQAHDDRLESMPESVTIAANAPPALIPELEACFRANTGRPFVFAVIVSP
jgi:hypothetical protein